MSEEIRLYHGNAKDLVLQIEDKSQDLILTDPPYDLKTHNIRTPPLSASTKEILAKNFKRILKPTGNLVIFVGLHDKFRWHEKLTKYGFALRSEIIMVYPPGIKSGKRFLSAHESAMHYSISKNYYFKEDSLYSDVYQTMRARGVTRNWGYDYKTAPAEKMHVTPKPLGLVQQLVETLSPPSGSVFDPFMGSGTTGEACVITGRKFIGGELITDIFEFARQRIERAVEKSKNRWW